MQSHESGPITNDLRVSGKGVNSPKLLYIIKKCNSKKKIKIILQFKFFIVILQYYIIRKWVQQKQITLQINKTKLPQ
jgi:hypothetical protein